MSKLPSRKSTRKSPTPLTKWDSESTLVRKSTLSETTSGYNVTFARPNSDLLSRFDDASSDGVFAVKGNPSRPRHNLRALDAFCEEHGIKPNELTPAQLKKFELQ